MRKLAVFVEGQTEQIFVERLILELANKNEVEMRLMNRAAHPVLVLEGEATDEGLDQKYFVLIYDCQTDGQVKPKIIESAARLSEEGFHSVLGLLDLYPFDLSEVDLYRDGLASGLPQVGSATKIHVAVAEVEAWFLQEGRHYEKIHLNLTPALIKGSLGFDPLVDSAELVAHPADLLRDIYRLVNFGYAKKRNQVNRTVHALDLENLCAGCCTLIPSFTEFCSSIEEFLTPSA